MLKTKSPVSGLNFPLGSLPEPTFADVLLRQGILDRISKFTRPHVVRLLHHFSSMTVASMGLGTTPQQAWCLAIPIITSKHRFVIHDILAINSLHIAQIVDCEDARDDYRNVAATELNTGLAQYISRLNMSREQTPKPCLHFLQQLRCSPRSKRPPSVEIL